MDEDPQRRPWETGKDCSDVRTPGATEAGKGKEGASSLEVSEGARPCQHLAFGLPASRAVRKHISVISSHSVCGTLLWEP